MTSKCFDRTRRLGWLAADGARDAETVWLRGNKAVPENPTKSHFRGFRPGFAPPDADGRRKGFHALGRMAVQKGDICPGLDALQ